MANKVCPECKKAIVLSSSDIVNNPVDGKYYHIHCYEEWQWRKQLFEYICDLWNLKAPGPANYKLRKLYKEQLNCTDLDLLMCLKYAYEVKKISKNKAQSRIGIIPYIFEEAKEYYKKQEKTVIENCSQYRDTVVSLSFDLFKEYHALFSNSLIIYLELNKSSLSSSPSKIAFNSRDEFLNQSVDIKIELTKKSKLQAINQILNVLGGL